MYYIYIITSSNQVKEYIQTEDLEEAIHWTLGALSTVNKKAFVEFEGLKAIINKLNVAFKSFDQRTFEKNIYLNDFNIPYSVRLCTLPTNNLIQ
ncbi:hypothetical protein V6R21_01595 [Limibacter armeniacum]|uniref:hypothetical protein n=1 Tax=Limibacter armeniacum TaxID=466084 RepID=UPI002FE6546E